MKELGDGLMCVEGAEMAQEDDERQGVRCVRFWGQKRMVVVEDGSRWGECAQSMRSADASSDTFMNAF